MMKFIIALALAVTVTFVKGQNLKEYDWSKEVPAAMLTASEENEPAVLLNLNKMYEFVYTNKEQTELQGYYVFHQIVKINNEEALESFNKSYVGVNEVSDLITLKARTITADGKVIETGKEALREMKEEDGSVYKMLAIEGAGKGSIIEILSVKKVPFRIFGKEYYQSSVPTREARFSFSTPHNLDYDFKLYNWEGTVTDTVIDKVRTAEYIFKNIDDVKNEDYAYIKTNLARVEYKFAYNRAGSGKRLYTFPEAAQKLYTNVYLSNTSADEKAADKFFKKIKLEKSMSPDAKALAIEKVVKQEIVNHEQGFDDIAGVISNKTGTDLGITRLTAALLRRAEVKHELVLTSDRSEKRFDPDFDTWSALDEFLIYLPETKQYMGPAHEGYYLGMVPAEYTANHGLFIKKMELGGTELGLGEVKFIDPVKADISFDDFLVDIDFQQDVRTTDVRIKRSMGGYNSAVYMHYYPLLDDEEKQKLTKGIMEYIAKDAEFDSLYVVNKTFGESPLDTPFEVVAKFSSGNLVEKAGDKFLFKIGSVIGEQHEMYEEEARKTNVEMPFNHTYKRVISFNVPEGYVIRNPEDLNLKVVTNQDGKDIYGFVSTYKQDGSKYIVTIDEYYHEIFYPKEKFEDVRKVVNAAADFNKVVLVMEKAN